MVAVDVRNSNFGDSQKAKVFKDSIRRAFYKSSEITFCGLLPSSHSFAKP